MCREGHQFHALLHEYPIDLVLNLLQASRQIHQEEILRRAIGVSLGIRDAWGEGGLVKSWLEEQQEITAPGADTPAQPMITPRAAAALSGGPVFVRGKDGR